VVGSFRFPNDRWPRHDQSGLKATTRQRRSVGRANDKFIGNQALRSAPVGSEQNPHPKHFLQNSLQIAAFYLTLASLLQEY